VGIASFGEGQRAAAWQGSAESYLDLHGLLQDAGYTSSIAKGVVVDGREIRVCGHAYIGGLRHAILWTIELPDTTPPVIHSATVNPSVLWPTNKRLVPISFDVDASDESGVASWGIKAVTCNEKYDTSDISLIEENDEQELMLRATRNPGRSRTGRIYTIELRAWDEAGNLSDPYEVTVTVAHDHRWNHKSMDDPRRARPDSPAKCPNPRRTIFQRFSLKEWRPFKSP
jgi:hypothetical protein